MGRHVTPPPLAVRWIEVDQRVTHIGAISDPPAPPRRRPRPARRRRARAAA